MRQAVIVARVSTNKQEDDGVGLEVQVADCKRFAESNGFKVYKVLQESISGTTDYDERESIREVIDLLERKVITDVIFHRVNRIGRERIIIENIIKKIYSLGGFISIVEKNRTYTNAKEAIKHLFWDNTISEYVRTEIIEQTNSGKRLAFESGSWFVKPIFGYRMVRINKITVPKIHDEEAKIVKLIFKMFIEEQSYRNIARNLNQKKIRTRSNKEWTTRAISDVINKVAQYGGQPFQYTTSFITAYSHEKEKHTREYQYPPILERETVTKVIQLLRYKRKRTSKNVLPLNGFVFCTCGRKVITRTAKKKKQRYYYVCLSSETYRQKKSLNQTHQNNYCKHTIEHTFVVTALKKALNNDFSSIYLGALTLLSFRLEADKFIHEFNEEINKLAERRKVIIDLQVEAKLNGQSASLSALEEKLHEINTQITQLDNSREKMKRKKNNIEEQLLMLDIDPTQQDKKGWQSPQSSTVFMTKINRLKKSIEQEDWSAVNKVLLSLGIKITVDLKQKNTEKRRKSIEIRFAPIS
ncbi:MAG: recombinase family protein [Candidatus Diapherotrites archaeon]